MPRGDGTGPMGMGPMTGRAAGYCAGYPTPGFMNPVGGRSGFGGWGGGRGRRNWSRTTGLPGWQRSSVGMPAWGQPGTVPPPVAAPMTGQAEVQLLKNQAEYLEGSLADIRKRLDELEKESADK